MTLLQALRDFVREALVGLARSLKVSALAVLTIGVSLFLAAAFYLVSRNLQQTVQLWRDQARLVLYLRPEATAAEIAALAERVRRSGWVTQIATVSRAQAEQRFRSAFPSLEELVEGGAAAELPASLEARLRPLGAADESSLRGWLDTMRREPAVELVDDDRDWIRQVETVLTVVRALGLVLTGVLVGASIFTIASVVRLTSYLYRDEIAVMRLVGATEFYIRGPFYLEGMFQGLLGALLALGALAGIHAALQPRLAASLVVNAVAGGFLLPAEIGGLLAFGALAGLAGAVFSLGREQVGRERA